VINPPALVDQLIKIVISLGVRSADHTATNYKLQIEIARTVQWRSNMLRPERSRLSNMEEQ
jgi:hypothetical protein